MLPGGKHGNHTVIVKEMPFDTTKCHYTTFENLVYTQFYILGYTEGFSFQELPWSQRQAIFFESSQIGEYLFYLSYKNRNITQTILKDKSILP